MSESTLSNPRVVSVPQKRAGKCRATAKERAAACGGSRRGPAKTDTDGRHDKSTLLMPSPLRSAIRFDALSVVREYGSAARANKGANLLFRLSEAGWSAVTARVCEKEYIPSLQLWQMEIVRGLA